MNTLKLIEIVDEADDMAHSLALVPAETLIKFAELLVQQCIAQCDKNKDHEWLGSGSKLSAFNIKEHFGVKE